MKASTVARMLGVTAKTIRTWLETGVVDVRHVNVGGSYFLNDDDVYKVFGDVLPSRPESDTESEDE
jgi:predicted site-specific integrase-resolvase